MKITIEASSIDELRSVLKDLLAETAEPFNSLHEQPIESLNLTMRTQNVLKGEDIFKVGQLIPLSETALLKMPNMGRKSANEIRFALLSYLTGRLHLQV